jgi:hypothetical protein
MIPEVTGQSLSIRSGQTVQGGLKDVLQSLSPVFERAVTLLRAHLAELVDQ